MPRYELETTQRQERILLEELRRFEIDTLAQNTELRIRKPGPPIAELRKQRSGLRVAGFEKPRGSPIYGARVPEILPHPLGRAPPPKEVRGGLLRVKGKQVAVPPRRVMQKASKREEKPASR